MRNWIFYGFLAIMAAVRTVAQEVASKSIDSTAEGFTVVKDSLYREDQIYLEFTFNILTNKPDDILQNGFSGGFHTGFIRDFPINARRNKAIGVGLGYGVATYSQNLLISGESNSEQTTFQQLESNDFDRNRFTFHMIELPLEYRWRTSTVRSRKFWRIYSGIRARYAYQFNSTFRNNGDEIRQRKVEEFNNLQLGATLTFGWNTFNFHVYYGLIPLFSDKAVTTEEQGVGFNELSVGLSFYLL